MPICPIDNVALIPFSEDINTVEGSFWECPVHKGRFVISGIKGLSAISTSVISNPPSGYVQVTNLYQDEDGLLYVKNSSGDPPSPISGGGDLTYLELNAIGLSAGSLNLTDAAWNQSKVQVDFIKVTVTAGSVTDFDIAIFEKDTFLAADKRYEAQGLNSTDNWEDDIELVYIDDDATKEVHFKITENAGGPGTYAVQLRGIKLI